MNSPSSRKTDLQALNDLLVRERQAITHLRMSQLGEIQQEKTRLLKMLQQRGDTVDDEEKSVITAIKTNNERNRLLLESGLQLIKRLQKTVFRNMALTYAPYGRALNIGVGPRMLNRSV